MSHHLDLSLINLILKSDIKEPPHFRHTWQERIVTCLSKVKKVWKTLMGWAKNLVKICIHNNRLINIRRDSCSCYPHNSWRALWNYETIKQPKHSENGLDYCIRLNKPILPMSACEDKGKEKMIQGMTWPWRLLNTALIPAYTQPSEVNLLRNGLLERFRNWLTATKGREN